MSKTYRVTHVPNPVEIILSTKEANVIAIQRVCDVCNWKRDWFLKPESGVTYVTERVFAHTTHSFSYEERIRQATDDDLITFKIVEKLKNL